MKQKYIKAYEEYQENPFITTKQLEEKYDFSISSFYRAIKKEGLSLPHKNFTTTCSKERLSLAVDLYNSGKSIAEISRILKMGEKTLSKYLSFLNIKIRNKAKKTKDLFCNYDFFHVIDTEEKAYWLGFIFADGCIRSDKTYRLTIELGNVDVKHLEKFKSSICSNHPIKARKNRSVSNVSINSKKIISDLKQFGCIQNKTYLGYINKDKINIKYYSHFLRGYFDGNGYLDKKRYRIIITLNLRSMAEKIAEMFYFYDINAKIVSINSYYRVIIEDKFNFVKALRLLYNDAHIYLTRKYEIYKKWKINLPLLSGNTQKQREELSGEAVKSRDR